MHVITLWRHYFFIKFFTFIKRMSLQVGIYYSLLCIHNWWRQTFLWLCRLNIIILPQLQVCFHPVSISIILNSIVNEILIFLIGLCWEGGPIFAELVSTKGMCFVLYCLGIPADYSSGFFWNHGSRWTVRNKKNNLAPVINSIDDDAVRMNDVTGTCWRPERQYVEWLSTCQTPSSARLSTATWCRTLGHVLCSLSPMTGAPIHYIIMLC